MLYRGVHSTIGRTPLCEMRRVGENGARLLAKLELRNFLTEHHPALAQRISGVEPLDHPSDGALLDLARRFFKADDRMHPQTH